MLHAPMYDAVNGISRTHQQYLVPSAVPAAASKEAAASAAARVVLSSLFPTNSARFDALYEATLAGIPDGPQKRMGLRWGEIVGHKILAARVNDGSTAVVAPPSLSGPGYWEPTPAAFAPYLLPQWGFVKPFAIATILQIRPPG